MSVAPSVMIVLTDAQSAVLVAGMLRQLREAGLRPILVTSPGELAREVAWRDEVTLIELPLHRAMSPLADLRSLWHLVQAMRTHRPTLVDGSTPKAGLLALIAATLTGVPHRVHTLRGLRYATLRGPRRAAVFLGHLVTCALADQVVCVSASLRDHAIQAGLVTPTRAITLGNGSSHGVDLVALAADAHRVAGRMLRRDLGIPDEARVVTYVGRLARDKGIAELAAAWRLLCGSADTGTHLVVCGDPDPTDPVEPHALHTLRTLPRVHAIGFRRLVGPVYAASDVVVLPSHREGFCNVLIEAGAMALPVVATRIGGCVDAVIDGTTGTLVPVRDAAALATAISRYLADGSLRARHGAAARQQVEHRFDQHRVWAAWIALYRGILGTAASPARPAARRAAAQA